MKNVKHKKLFSSLSSLVRNICHINLSFLIIIFIYLTHASSQYAQTAGAISIQDFQFVPSAVTITVGGTVTWTNQSQGGNFHTTTSDIQGTANSWDSGLTKPGQTFSKTFTTPGTYTFHCNVHTFMRGTITVVAAATPTPTSTPIPTPTFTPIPTPTSTPIPTSTPTPTTAVGNTTLSVNLCPHGLGICGDNASPNGGAGNTVPKHTQKAVSVTLLDANSNPVSTQQGTVTYNQTAKNFQGIVGLNAIANGQYLIRVKIDDYLVKQVPGFVTIVNGQSVTTPPVSLVAGDINNDGQIDILDYNLLVGCFGTKQNTASCTMPPTTQTQGADINDDGLVNGGDYNLFLRELSVQIGQ